MKVALTLVLLTGYSVSISLKSVKKNVASSAGEFPTRKLLMEEAGMPSGNTYVEQLQSTNSNMNQMTVHSRRQTEMKQVGQWFLDIDERMDDFRDAISRKLNELHMALSQPHPAKMMNPQLNGQMMNIMGSMPQPMSASKPLDEEEEKEEEAEGDEDDRMRFMHI